MAGSNVDAQAVVNILTERIAALTLDNAVLLARAQQAERRLAEAEGGKKLAAVKE